MMPAKRGFVNPGGGVILSEIFTVPFRDLNPIHPLAADHFFEGGSGGAN